VKPVSGKQMCRVCEMHTHMISDLAWERIKRGGPAAGGIGRPAIRRTDPRDSLHSSHGSNADLCNSGRQDGY